MGYIGYELVISVTIESLVICISSDDLFVKSLFGKNIGVCVLHRLIQLRLLCLQQLLLLECLLRIFQVFLLFPLDRSLLLQGGLLRSDDSLFLGLFVRCGDLRSIHLPAEYFNFARVVLENALLVVGRLSDELSSEVLDRLVSVFPSCFSFVLSQVLDARGVTVLHGVGKWGLALLILDFLQSSAFLEQIHKNIELAVSAGNVHRSISKLVLMIDFATLVTDENVQDLLVSHLSRDEQRSLGKLVEDVGITASLE